MIKLKDLSLLPLSEGDKEFYFKIYSNQSLLQYVTTPLTRVESDKSFYLTLNKMSQPHPVIILNVITLNKTKEKIGVIGLRWNQLSSEQVEIGIILLEKYHGTGFAHAAKKALMQEAFDNLSIKKIVAHCEKNNHPANGANKKLGFKQVGQFTEKNSSIVKIKWEKINE
jgi:RimJ/RimL family protein N-acetyltransferase